MKYLSVCSGIEAASVAFHPLGWKPLAFSEIEAFPRAVLQHHYPDTPCHGDFTALKDERWIVDADLLCGGTPCQAFSVAGNRKSLADDRGNLTLQYVLLADAIDHLRSTAGREPAWILWENVPGVLSTNDNAFGAFLGGLVGRTAPIPEPADGWTGAGVVDGPTRCAAWRILDAQHFGLAQRRKRVFVLARGGAGRWAVADALLPIIESSRWHPAPSRGKGERVAATIGCRAGGGGDLNPETSGGGNLIAHTLRGEGFDASEDGTGRGIPLVMATGQAGAEVVSDGSPSLTCNHESPIVFDPAQVTSVTNRSNPQPGDPYHTLHQSEPPMLVAQVNMQGSKGNAVVDDGDTSFTLNAMHGHDMHAVCIRMREGKEGGGKGPLVSEDQSLTLATGNDQVLATPINTQLGLRGSGTSNSTREGVGVGEPGDPAFTLQAAHHHAVQAGMQVRRLTPVECERLQGFPDSYTNIPWRGKAESPDGNRYKALGNSWAVPVVRWIGKQIDQVRNARLNG